MGQLSHRSDVTPKSRRGTFAEVGAPWRWRAQHKSMLATSGTEMGNKKPPEGGLWDKPESQLLDVLADQAGHLEHRDLGFAEDFFELGICVDHALIQLVLQIVFLDVDPELGDDLSAWDGV